MLLPGFEPSTSVSRDQHPNHMTNMLHSHTVHSQPIVHSQYCHYALKRECLHASTICLLLLDFAYLYTVLENKSSYCCSVQCGCAKIVIKRNSAQNFG